MLGAMGLVLVVFIYIVLGFMYAWITGIVSRDEISVKTGVLVVIMPLLARIAVFVGVIAMETEPSGLLVWLVATAADFAALVLGGRFIARVDWKSSLIIAGVYTVLLILMMQGLAMLAS